MTLQELFTDPSTWTKEYAAKDKRGLGVVPFDPNTVCWCLLGGIEKCYGSKWVEIVNDVHAHIRMPLSIWNDAPERTFEDIVQLVKELNI